LPETGQFDQRPGQALPVEVISLCQPGAQLGSAPPLKLVLAQLIASAVYE